MKDMTSRELLNVIDGAAKAVAERFKGKREVADIGRDVLSPSSQSSGHPPDRNPHRNGLTKVDTSES